MDFGIDFGTTRTVVACADRGNHPVVGFHDASGDAVQWIPTVVAERDGELRYGLDAAAGDDGAHVVRSFKRLLSSAAGPEQTVRVGATEIALGDLVAGFVAHVRDALVTRSDVRRSVAKGGLRAAVAVPANAHSAQRLITLDAFRRAGFESVAMLNEPSAAGFEYTHRHRDTLSSKRDVVGVYDLGGGTFDASVVRMSGPPHEVLATAGIARLGGDDFDTVARRGRPRPRRHRARSPRERRPRLAARALPRREGVAQPRLEEGDDRSRGGARRARARCPRSPCRSPTSTTRALRSWSAPSRPWSRS